MKTIESLEQSGYLTMRYPASLRKAVAEAIEAWTAFCALPEELKMRFAYTPDNLVGSGVGYELKKNAANMDVKEDFHARASQRPFLMKEAVKIGPAAIAFISAALNINTHLLPLVRDFARVAEKTCDMPGFEKDVANAISRWTLRFLHYFPNEDESGVMASQHTDKGCFTSHLWESAPGLERLSFDPDPAKRIWTSIPVEPGETMLFAGLRLQLRSHGRLKATCHRVVANEKTAKEGRISAVAFCDSLNTEYFDKARVGRTQGFPAGFNYDMPYDEYRTLFTKLEPA